MPDFTTYLNLEQPFQTEGYRIGAHNQNALSLDSAFQSLTLEDQRLSGEVNRLRTLRIEETIRFSPSLSAGYYYYINSPLLPQNGNLPIGFRFRGILPEANIGNYPSVTINSGPTGPAYIIRLHTRDADSGEVPAGFLREGVVHEFEIREDNTMLLLSSMDAVKMHVDERATSALFGHMRAAVGNGLNISSGVLSMALASLSAAGAVQLSSATNSTSATLAATPAAVNSVNSALAATNATLGRISNGHSWVRVNTSNNSGFQLLYGGSYFSGTNSLVDVDISPGFGTIPYAIAGWTSAVTAGNIYYIRGQSGASRLRFGRTDTSSGPSFGFIAIANFIQG